MESDLNETRTALKQIKENQMKNSLHQNDYPALRSKLAAVDSWNDRRNNQLNHTENLTSNVTEKSEIILPPPPPPPPPKVC